MKVKFKGAALRVDGSAVPVAGEWQVVGAPGEVITIAADELRALQRKALRFSDAELPTPMLRTMLYRLAVDADHLIHILDTFYDGCLRGSVDEKSKKPKRTAAKKKKG